jgi:Molecular chaperone GrpE (heat shock protein)
MTGKSAKKTEKEEESCADLVAEANAKAEEYLDIARRLQADFDNYRRRTQKDMDEFRKFANEGMAREILSVVDDMDRALQNTNDETEFVKGFRGIRQNLMKILETNGLSEIPTDGKFDPDLHEALCVTESDTDGDIAEVFQKGYRMNDRVIRYSKVRVTKMKKEGE